MLVEVVAVLLPQEALLLYQILEEMAELGLHLALPWAQHKVLVVLLMCLLVLRDKVQKMVTT